MGSSEKRTDSEKDRTFSSLPALDAGTRAAEALNRVLPPQNRDKKVATLFGVSLRMAQYLRVGQRWTIDRLNQASAELGLAFDAAFYSPMSTTDFHDELREIAERLARLEERANAGMVGGLDAGLAPVASAAARPLGGMVANDPREEKP